MSTMDETILSLTKLRAAFAFLARMKDIRYELSFSNIVQWGSGGNEAEILSQVIRLNTFSTSYILGIQRGRSRIAGGKRGQQAVPPESGRLDVAMRQGLQGLCGCRRPLGLCHHAIFQSGFTLHPVRHASECTVTTGRGRAGDEILRGYACALQGDERRRLRDCRFEIGWRLPKWRRPILTREAPCLARS